MKRALLLLSILSILSADALADGFHSPLLRNKDPKKWGETTREGLGLDKSDTAEEQDGGGDRFRRRKAAGDLVDVLRYLDRKNVLLREFPNFNYDAIPTFKSETEAILIAIGKDAVPLLVQTIVADIRGQHGNQAGLRRVKDFRERVVKILIAIGPDSLEHCIGQLVAQETAIRKTMLRIIRAVVTDVDFGSDATQWRRWFGIYDAGRKRDVTKVAEVTAALSDPDKRIRRTAIVALGQMRSTKPVPKLMAILESRVDPKTIALTCRALATIGDRRAVPRLITLLESETLSVRTEAATALRFLTRTMHGFRAQGAEEERKAAVLKWRRWWEAEMRKKTGGAK